MTLILKIHLFFKCLIVLTEKKVKVRNTINHVFQEFQHLDSILTVMTTNQRRNALYSNAAYKKKTVIMDILKEKNDSFSNSFVKIVLCY
uniref:Uncharacterized protein n=1 Tax=Strongyloides papillosus TaxID=174720 RepID=A0A0N5BRL9_STREA